MYSHIIAGPKIKKVLPVFGGKYSTFFISKCDGSMPPKPMGGLQWHLQHGSGLRLRGPGKDNRTLGKGGGSANVRNGSGNRGNEGITSWDKISSSKTESRLYSLDLHVMGSLSSLNFRSVSRSLGTVGMADNGWRSLAHARGSSRDNSTCLTEGCLGCFHLRSVSRNDGSIGMVYGSRGTLADTSTWSSGIDRRSRSCGIPVGIRFPPAWWKADLAAWTLMLWEALAAWTAGVSAGVMAPFSWLTMAGGP